MKLSFVFEDDEEVLVSDKVSDKPEPLAKVAVAVARPDGSGRIVLTRESTDKSGKEPEESKTFNASEKEILTTHLAELLDWLHTQTSAKH